MFYNFNNNNHTMVLLKKDIIFYNKLFFFLENISLNLNKTNCLFKGMNGSGKTLLLKYFNNSLSIPKLSLNYIILLFNLLYYSHNIYYYKYTIQNEFFKTLSYGNKQLFIFNLNTLILNKFLSLDEITNGLDKDNYLNILFYIFRLSIINKNILLISHRNILKLKYTLLYL